MSRLHQDYLEEKVSLVSEKSILLEVRAFEQKRLHYKSITFLPLLLPLQSKDAAIMR